MCFFSSLLRNILSFLIQHFLVYFYIFLRRILWFLIHIFLVYIYLIFTKHISIQDGRSRPVPIGIVTNFYHMHQEKNFSRLARSSQLNMHINIPSQTFPSSQFKFNFSKHFMFGKVIFPKVIYILIHNRPTIPMEIHGNYKKKTGNNRGNYWTIKIKVEIHGS